jgi:hypothetical protein
MQVERSSIQYQAENNHISQQNTVFHDRLREIVEVIVPDVIHAKAALLIKDDVVDTRICRANHQ